MPVVRHYSSHIAFGSDIVVKLHTKVLVIFLNSPLRYMIFETQICFSFNSSVLHKKLIADPHLMVHEVL